MNLKRNLWALWFFLVIFIYPIPHTIAIRNLLLVIGLGVLLYTWVFTRKDDSFFKNYLRPIKNPLKLLLLLTLVIALQSSFIALDPIVSMKLWLGDWVESLTVGLVGFGCSILVLKNNQLPSNTLATIILSALLLHLVILHLAQLGWWLNLLPVPERIYEYYGEGMVKAVAAGQYPLGWTPFANRDYHAIIAVTALALVLSDIVSRFKNGDAITYFSNQVLTFFLALILISLVTLITRNAVLVAVFLVIISLYYLRGDLLRKVKYKKTMLATILITLAVFIVATSSIGDRWSKSFQSIAVALDVDKHLYWRDGAKAPIPTLDDGQSIDESFYFRIAWWKVGLQGVDEYPLGVGYGHKAFGWYVNHHYQVQTGLESSHSGLLDFTLANGYIALILWLAFCFILIQLGLQMQGIGYTIALGVLAYLGRILLDGQFSGFRLELFMFMTGVFLAMGVFNCEAQRKFNT